ncbi:MAG: T9SS type A sorting domain-containing protein [Ignavibacteriales bacterium]|nr:T9SS type A sorting domain-containing protein [Ignavibacteriales bacterium]
MKKSMFSSYFYFPIILVVLSSPLFSQQLDTTAYYNNRFFITLLNNGDIGKGYRHQITYDSLHIINASGFFLSGKLGDSLWSNGVFGSESYLNYAPGKFLESSGDKKNKFYILNASETDFDSSWHDWKEAVELGAYFYDGNNDGVYNPVDLNGNGIWDANEDRPDLIGDYTNWTIYSDKVETEDRWYSINNPGQPQGIEIRQSVFAYTTSENEILDNTFFLRYIVENVSENEVYDSVYFGFVSDPDIGSPGGELMGTDTTLNCVYSYMKNEDSQWNYGANPPSVVSILLQGPRIKSENNDTSYVRRGKFLGEEYIFGAKNLKMSSSFIFGHYGLWAEDIQQALRNVMIGGKYPNGSDIKVKDYWGGNGDLLGSSDSINSNYLFTGDPITGSGWLNIYENDWRMLGSTGPFKLEKNKPQEIIIALVIARGNSPLNSVSLVKEYARGVKSFYESNFTEFPVSVEKENSITIPTKFILYQNYPNPFNPTTTIEYSIPSKVKSENANVKLIVYDVLGRVITTLVNIEQSAGLYKVNFNAGKLASGVYYAQLKYGEYIQTKKMLLLK